MASIWRCRNDESETDKNGETARQDGTVNQLHWPRPYATQVFANTAGVFANTNTGIQKYDYAGTLIWTSATSAQGGWGLYILGQQAYYTSGSTIGRVNDVY